MKASAAIPEHRSARRRRDQRAEWIDPILQRHGPALAARRISVK
jgi:hypothetical protein